MPPAKPNTLTIIVASAEGDTVTLELNAHEHLHQLLKQALKELYGNPPRDPTDYDVVINGQIGNLDQTIVDAGLVDGAEVAVVPKDVSRG